MNLLILCGKKPFKYKSNAIALSIVESEHTNIEQGGYILFF